MADACTETAPGGDGLGAVFGIVRALPEAELKSDVQTHQAIWPSDGRTHVLTHALVPRGAGRAETRRLHAMDSSSLASIWQRAETARGRRADCCDSACNFTRASGDARRRAPTCA